MCPEIRESERLSFIRDLFARVDNQATERFLELLAPNVSYWFGNQPALTGHEAVRRGLNDFFGGVASVRHELEEVWEGPASAAVQARVFYERLDGRHVDLPAVTVIHFDSTSGLITRYQAIGDITPLLAP